MSTATWNALVEGWAGLMQRALVDGTIVLLLVGAVWWPLRRRAPAQLGYGLFLLVLVALPVHVAPPASLGSVLPRSQVDRVLDALSTAPAGAALSPPPIVPGRTVPAAAAAPLSTSARPLPAAGWLLLAWASVVALLLARFVIAQVQTARAVRRARPIDPARLPVDFARACRRLGLRRRIEVRETRELAAPAAFGLRRPCVLLPRGLRRALSPAQLEWVLLHELAHVRRGDLWVALAQRLVQIVYFFHPAVWIASRIVDEQREFACDDAALAASGLERRACGAGFVRIAEWAHDRRPVAGAALGLFDRKQTTRRRLMRILDPRRRPAGRTSLATGAFVLATGLLVLPAETARAQEPATAVQPELARLRARLDRLQQENDHLRARLDALQHGAQPHAAHGATVSAPASAPGGGRPALAHPPRPRTPHGAFAPASPDSPPAAATPESAAVCTPRPPMGLPGVASPPVGAVPSLSGAIVPSVPGMPGVARMPSVLGVPSAEGVPSVPSVLSVPGVACPHEPAAPPPDAARTPSLRGALHPPTHAAPLSPALGIPPAAPHHPPSAAPPPASAPQPATPAAPAPQRRRIT